MGERAFGAAVRPRQLTFDVDDSDAEPGPFVYVACRLTSLDAEHRKLLDSWCTHIQHAVTEAVDDSGDPWRVAVHTPLSWSAPWTDDGRTPQDIYALNSTKVAECAAPFGPVQVPPTSGEPPNWAKRFTLAAPMQEATVPLVPGSGGSGGGFMIVIVSA